MQLVVPLEYAYTSFVVASGNMGGGWCKCGYSVKEKARGFYKAV